VNSKCGRKKMDLSSSFPCVAMSVRHSWCCTRDPTRRISQAIECCANANLLFAADNSNSKYSRNAVNFSHCLSLYYLHYTVTVSTERTFSSVEHILGQIIMSVDRLNYRSNHPKYPLQWRTADGGTSRRLFRLRRVAGGLIFCTVSFFFYCILAVSANEINFFDYRHLVKGVLWLSNCKLSHISLRLCLVALRMDLARGQKALKQDSLQGATDAATLRSLDQQTGHTLGQVMGYQTHHSRHMITSNQKVFNPCCSPLIKCL
jgi:hypothetical protein